MAPLISQWAVEATQPLTSNQPPNPDTSKFGVLLYLTVLSDIQPATNSSYGAAAADRKCVTCLGPSPNAHIAFGVLNFGNSCRAYFDSGQTKHCCQVRWLPLANNGDHEPRLLVGLIDLDSPCRICRKRGSTIGARITMGRRWRCRTRSGLQIACHDYIHTFVGQKSQDWRHSESRSSTHRTLRRYQRRSARVRW